MDVQVRHALAYPIVNPHEGFLSAPPFPQGASQTFRVRKKGVMSSKGRSSSVLVPKRDRRQCPGKMGRRSRKAQETSSRKISLAVIVPRTRSQRTHSNFSILIQNFHDIYRFLFHPRFCLLFSLLHSDVVFSLTVCDSENVLNDICG